MITNTQFRPKDFKEASDAFCSLNIEAIDKVIDSGIPLDVPEYTLNQMWTKSSAIHLIASQCTNYESAYGKKKRWAGDEPERKKWTYDRYIEECDKVLAHVMKRCPHLPVTIDDIRSILIDNMLESFKYLMSRGGVDVEVKDYSGATILSLIEARPVIKEYYEQHKDDVKPITSESIPVKVVEKGKTISEFSNEKLTKLFKKFLTKRVSDLEFALAQEGPTIPFASTNQYSMEYKFNDPYYRISGKSDDLTFYCLMECLREELAKNKKVTKDRLIENAYHILTAIRMRIPLKRLEELAFSTNELPPYESLMCEQHAWQWWEQESEDSRGFGLDAQSLNIHFDNRDEVVATVKQLAEHFDDYLMYWRYSPNPYYFRISDLSDNYKTYDEDDFFRKVVQFPEIEPYATGYVEKITEHNKNKFVLYSKFTGSAIAYARGCSAAGIMSLNEANDEKLLAFLQTLPERYRSKPGVNAFGYIKHIWEGAGRVPNLAKTFAEYPNLKPKTE